MLLNGREFLRSTGVVDFRNGRRVGIDGCRWNGAALRKSLRFNRLNSLTRFGPLLAIRIHVNHELESMESDAVGRAEKYSAVELGTEDVRRLRHLLHEMANVFTGVLVSGGLLQQALRGDRRQRYCDEICSSGDRGAVLVREARQILLAPSERMQD